MSSAEVAWVSICKCCRAGEEETRRRCVQTPSALLVMQPRSSLTACMGAGKAKSGKNFVEEEKRLQRSYGVYSGFDN